jgi:hypothetical protein
MARATLATVKQMVYENLGISPDTYGTLVANKRYKSGYIDDAIIQADFRTVHILYKNKQELLLEEILTNTVVPDSGDAVPWTTIGIVEVNILVGAVTREGREISYGVFQEWTDNDGSIYDASYMNYHYAIHDGNLHFFGDQATVKHLDLTHPNPLVSLKSPQGFEGPLASLASAILLEKRNDNPEQAAAYRADYEAFMQIYMIPDTNLQNEVQSE